MGYKIERALTVLAIIASIGSIITSYMVMNYGEALAWGCCTIWATNSLSNLMLQHQSKDAE